MSYTCPKDGAALVEAGQTQRCETCDGAWIDETALIALLEQRTSKLWNGLVWEPRADGAERPCAVCKEPMQTVNLGRVELDRCPQHGVWFDADELTALLKQSRRMKTDPGTPDGEAPRTGDEHHGLLDSLRKLFKR